MWRACRAHLVCLLSLLLAAPAYSQQSGSGIDLRNVTNNNNIRYANAFTGVDAGAQIAAAITDLGSGGGIVDARGIFGAQTISTAINITTPVQVWLGSTTYTYTGASTSYIFALSTGGASLIGINPTATIITTAGAANGVQPGTNTTVAHLTLRGPNSSMSPSQGINSGSADNVRIENVTIEQWGNHGINTGGSSTRWFIANNLVQNNTNDGILLSGASNFGVVTGNVVRNNGSNGIDTNSNNGVISNNIVDSNGSGHSSTDCWGILVGAVSGFSANYNTITGNTVNNSTCQNIILKPFTSQTVNFNTVAGNTTLGGTAANNDGITLDGSSAGTLHGNVITGNTVKNPIRHGIFVDGSVGTVTGNSVTGNTVEGAGTNGIFLGTGATDSLVVGNITTGNTSAQLVDSGTTTIYGVNRIGTGTTSTTINGGLTVGTLFSNTDVVPAANNHVYWTSRTALGTPNDGTLTLTNVGVTAGVSFDAAIDKTLHLTDRADATGMELNLGTPTLGTCTGGTLVSGSHNFGGEVTGTTGGSCIVNFGSPNFANSPFCLAMDETAAGIVNVTAKSASSITIGNITSGHAVMWHCFGRIGT